MNILGLNVYHGDAAACLLVDGKLEFAIEEERLRRVKHWAGFPSLAVRACLEHAGFTLRDIDHVAVGRDPTANLFHKLRYALGNRPPLALLRDRVSNQRKVRDLRRLLAESQEFDPTALEARLHHVEHHLAHLASSFYLSPYDEAVCVSIDGFGDFASTMWGVGRGKRLVPRRRVLFPHSLGVFYTAGTQFLGFPRFGDEYKVMGLAPHGNPGFVEALEAWVRTDERGGLRLSLEAFRHPREVIDTRWDDCEPEVAAYFSSAWDRRFGPPRAPEEPLTSAHRDMARSLQQVFEAVYFNVLSHSPEPHSVSDLALAGGCAFNSVANGKILDRTRFRRWFVGPAAGDAGTAVGAALLVWHDRLGNDRVEAVDHAFLGPEFPESVIRRALDDAGLAYTWFDDAEELVQRTASQLESGRIVGWFQGRAEWGPRALGNRSILADPRHAATKATLNAKIKRREDFRPFAPAVLGERTGEFFDCPQPAPFMNLVCPVLPGQRGRLQAVTHVDGSARVQTVARDANPLFHRLLEAFGERSGIPVLLNTSFNESEPIVHTPAEAVACFKRTGMDVLVLGPALAQRTSP